MRLATKLATVSTFSNPLDHDDFRCLADRLPMPVFVIDAQSDALDNLYVNCAMQRLTGRDVSTLQSGLWWQSVHDDDRHRLMDRMRAPGTNEGSETHIRLRMASGTHRLFCCQLTPVTRDGELLRWIGMCTDIHDEMDAHDRAVSRCADQDGLPIAAVPDRHDLLLRATNDAFWDWDLTTDEVSRGAAFETLFGWPLNEMEDAKDWWISRIHPDDRDRVLASNAAAIAKEERWTCAYRFRRADGRYAHVIDRGFIARDHEGRALRFVGAMVDISDREEADRAVKRTAETFTQLVDENPFGIYIVDADFKIARVSRGARKAFANVRPLIGRDFAEAMRILWPEPSALKFITRFRHTLDSGEPYNQNNLVEHRADVGGVEAYDWRIERIAMPDGRFAVACFFYDQTEQQQAARMTQFRVELNDCLRATDDPEAMMDAATALLGRNLGAAQVGFAEVDDDDAHVTVRRDWNDGRIPSVVGRWRLDDFGPSLVKSIRKGKTVAIPDIESDLRTSSESARTNFAAIKTRAIAERAVIRNGQMCALLFTHNPEPRQWTDDELALIEETVDRLWSAVQRARAEARLRESEARLAQAQDMSGIGSWRWDHKNREGLVSPNYRYLHGLPPGPSRVSEDELLLVVHPDDVADIGRGIRRAIEGERAMEVSYRVRLPDGSERRIRGVGRALRNGTGPVTQSSGIVEDVTERRANEDALREVATRLQLAQEAAAIGVWEGNLAEREVFWSPEIFKLYGRDPALGTPHIDEFKTFVHPDDYDAFMSAPSTLNGDGAYEMEFRIKTPDGGWRWLMARTRVVEERDGKPYRVVGVNIDLTKRKLVEAELAASEARFRMLADAMPALVFVANQHGNTYVNSQFLSYTGLPREQLLGQEWIEVIKPDDRSRIIDVWRRESDNTAPFEAVYRLRRHDGTYRWHLVRCTSIRNENGAIMQWVGACTDIQELVEAREAIARSRDEMEVRVIERTAMLEDMNERLKEEIAQRETTQAALVQAQKLEALGQLTSGIAHDFNNVIQAVAAGFTLIKRRVADPKIAEIADISYQAALRGGDLVAQLLAFARQQVLEPQTVSVSTLLHDAQPLIERAVGPGIILTVDCPDDLPAMRVDRAQLETALINLAVNARDAMPSGGALTIVARRSRRSEPGRPTELGNRKAIAIRVEDSGTGMSADVMQRILEPFFTTKALGKGTGLGLAMVHGFLKQSDGALRVDSEEGKGSAFTLYIPVARHRDHFKALGDDAQTIDTVPPMNVLVVDDDSAVRATTAAQVADLGHQVHDCATAAEALARLDGHPVDLLLTDVVMPSVDGVALVKAARAKRPTLPVLFVTGHADREQLEGEYVLDKPYTLPALNRALAKAAKAR